MVISLTEMVQRLAPLGEHYGISFCEVPAEEDLEWADGILVSPFSLHLGVELPHTVLYQQGAPSTALIHEMGHLLFGVHEDEYRWMGWEWSVAQLLGVERQWLEESGDYVVYEVETGMSTILSRVEDLPFLFEERLEEARESRIRIPSAEDLGIDNG